MSGVVCSGNIVFDILTRPVDHIPWGGTYWVDSIEYELGGNAANTSYTLARLGVRVRILGAVGRDDAGAAMRKRLADGGVDVSCVEWSGLPTATTVGLVQSNGTRAFLHQPGCSRTVFAEPVDFVAQGEARFTRYHLGNPFALVNVRRHGPEMLRRARAAGLGTSLDTAWDALGEWMKVVAPSLAETDILFVNEDEAKMLTGHTAAAAAARTFRDEGAHDIVIKLGARGCAIFSEGGEWEVPGFAVPVVDTTGAGDCFVGGFLAGLEKGLGMREAGRLANAVGALNVASLGATRGIRDYEATLAWMKAATSASE